MAETTIKNDSKSSLLLKLYQKSQQNYRRLYSNFQNCSTDISSKEQEYDEIHKYNTRLYQLVQEKRDELVLKKSLLVSEKKRLFGVKEKLKKLREQEVNELSDQSKLIPSQVDKKRKNDVILRKKKSKLRILNQKKMLNKKNIENLCDLIKIEKNFKVNQFDLSDINKKLNELEKIDKRYIGERKRISKRLNEIIKKLDFSKMVLKIQNDDLDFKIDRIEKLIQKNEIKYNAIQSNKQKELNELNKIRLEIKRTKRRLNDIKSEQNRLKSNMIYLKESGKGIQSEIKRIKERERNIDTYIRKRETLIEELKDEIQMVERNITVKEDDYSDIIEQQNKNLIIEKNRLLSKLIETKNNIYFLLDQIQTKKRVLKEIYESSKENQKQKNDELAMQLKYVKSKYLKLLPDANEVKKLKNDQIKLEKEYGFLQEKYIQMKGRVNPTFNVHKSRINETNINLIKKVNELQSHINQKDKLVKQHLMILRRIEKDYSEYIKEESKYDPKEIKDGNNMLNTIKSKRKNELKLLKKKLNTQLKYVDNQNIQIDYYKKKYNQIKKLFLNEKKILRQRFKKEVELYKSYCNYK